MIRSRVSPRVDGREVDEVTFWQPGTPRRFRAVGAGGRADYSIGCIVLTRPFFFERDQWIPAPGDFAKNIVTGKTCDLEMETGRQLWNDVQVRLAAARGITIAAAPSLARRPCRRWRPRTSSR